VDIVGNWRAGKAWETSMTVRVGNLFVDVSAGSSGEEAFSEIFARPGLKIERIISQGQASPPGFWYDQAWNEWVILLKGMPHCGSKTSLPRGHSAQEIMSSSPQGNATASSGRSRNSQRSGSPSVSSERLSQLD
jgi:hypothetical protein